MVAFPPGYQHQFAENTHHMSTVLNGVFLFNLACRPGVNGQHSGESPTHQASPAES